MSKKYLSESFIYFVLFFVITIYYIINGNAILGTNDDWALWGMLNYKGIYGTLIMSYPLSFIMNNLYSIFPSIPWYSLLLTSVLLVNYYLVAIYIKNIDSYLQKIAIFAVSFLLLSFFMFSATITTITAITMISAIALIKKDLNLSFLFVFIAFLLRTDIMFLFMPYYIVAFFILRDNWRLSKKELYGLITLIVLIAISLYIQSQDKFYMDWLKFNKARSAIVDLAILNVDKNYFSTIEKLCYQVGWFQDPQLLSTKKLIATSPSFYDVLMASIGKLDLNYFIKLLKYYKFNFWLWLLLGASFIVILMNIKNIKSFFIVIFMLGVILLLAIRDVDRVTVPLIILWAYITFETLKSSKYKVFSTIFIIAFAYIYYFYMSGLFEYNVYKENTKLLKEAKTLIKDSNKSCEVSINFPTYPSTKLNKVFTSNYLFRENSWLKINDKEILPTGWLVRNRFFYETHNLSDKNTTRKYKTYHDFLIDSNTAFFGSKKLVKSKSFNYLLKTYDKLYLKNRPNCKHTTKIIKKSKNFAISQIVIDCKKDK